MSQLHHFWSDIGPKTAYWRMNQDGGRKDDEKDEEEDTEERGTEVQYLIKWLGYSHLHNTWETGGVLFTLNYIVFDDKMARQIFCQLP